MMTFPAGSQSLFKILFLSMPNIRSQFQGLASYFCWKITGNDYAGIKIVDVSLLMILQMSYQFPFLFE
jgi:hypothetical protein